MPKSNLRLLLFTLISGIAYFILAYLTPREDTTILFLLYSCLFATYIASYYTTEELNIKQYLYIAIGLRLLLLFSVPLLSDDIYRFIWDGRLLANGISPFKALPIDYITNQSLQIPGIDSALFNLLNSPEYFTVYPPLSQLVFWFAAVISPDRILGSILVIRVSIVLAEVSSIFLITRLLKHYQLPTKNILLYALNPLVVLELTGNLHFEAFVILFTLLAIYLILKGKTLLSGISWSLAIGFKLIPLIFLPFFIRRLNLKNQLVLYAITGFVTILLFLPLYDRALIDGLSSSLTLYFQKFEFNASVYYLIRTIGYWFKGYNIIAHLGPTLAILTLVAIIGVSLLSSFSKKNLPAVMMWSLLIYLSLATTVHPWYITTLVVLSIFSTYRFPILWSLLIFVTYAGYSISGYVEPIYLIVLEYLALVIFIGYEILHHTRISHNRSE